MLLPCPKPRKKSISKYFDAYTQQIIDFLSTSINACSSLNTPQILFLCYYFGYFDLTVLRAFGEEIVKYLFNSTGHFLSSFLPRHSLEKLNVD